LSDRCSCNVETSSQVGRDEPIPQVSRRTDQGRDRREAGIVEDRADLAQAAGTTKDLIYRLGVSHIAFNSNHTRAVQLTFVRDLIQSWAWQCNQD